MGADGDGHGLPSPPIATAACGMGKGEVAAWRQCHGRHCVDEQLLENPLANFKRIAKRSLAGFSNLKEEPGHFYKFQKNSYKLPLSFRSFTKKWGSKLKSFDPHLFTAFN